MDHHRLEGKVRRGRGDGKEGMDDVCIAGRALPSQRSAV